MITNNCSFGFQNRQCSTCNISLVLFFIALFPSILIFWFFGAMNIRFATYWTLRSGFIALNSRFVCRIQEENRIRSSDDVQNHEGESEGGGQEVELRSGIELSNLWLHAGRFSEVRPRRLDWEATHVREEVLGARSSAAISGKLELGSRTDDFLSNSSNAEKGESMHFNFDSIQVCSGLCVEQCSLCSNLRIWEACSYSVNILGFQVHVILVYIICLEIFLCKNGRSG